MCSGVAVMSKKMHSLLVVLIILGISQSLQGCESDQFQCFNGKCIKRSWFCDNTDDCKDNSDERYCNTGIYTSCLSSWFSCANAQRCIPSYWRCDGTNDCKDNSDEKNCGGRFRNILNVTRSRVAKAMLSRWFLERRKSWSTTDKWGPQLYRTAVALHLAKESTINQNTSLGEEINYELTIQLLQRFTKEKRISSQELALYIHALIVTCIDPRDFYGANLVLNLRRRVEDAGNYTNPFQILALCNAGDTMTTKDVDRVIEAFDSQHRLFWTDTQALATLALACLSSRSGLTIDERILKDMQKELKRKQFRNGTVDNVRTTSLVIQALLIHDSYKQEFDLDAAIRSVVDGVSSNVTLLNAYYALPVLSSKSLLNISSSHCSKTLQTEAEALQKALDMNGERIAVKYSVWIGDQTDLARTWRLKMHLNHTLYDVIETVARIDNRQKVEYNVVDGKPYVAALGGLEDDPEMGRFWFTYLKSTSDEEPKFLELSPVDMRVQKGQEIILWYKAGQWSQQPTVKPPLVKPSTVQTPTVKTTTVETTTREKKVD